MKRIRKTGSGSVNVFSTLTALLPLKNADPKFKDLFDAHNYATGFSTEKSYASKCVCQAFEYRSDCRILTCHTIDFRSSEETFVVSKTSRMGYEARLRYEVIGFGRGQRPRCDPPRAVYGLLKVPGNYCTRGSGGWGLFAGRVPPRLWR